MPSAAPGAVGGPSSLRRDHPAAAPARRPVLARPAGSPARGVAGPGSCNSSGRSRRRTSSAARRCGTGSAGRAISTTSPPTPRSSSPRPTTRWQPACSRRSARSAATSCSRRSSRRGAASSATGSATSSSERVPDRRAARRCGSTSWLSSRTTQGYLAEAIVGTDGSISLREHNCAIYHVATGTPAACQAELELFREVLGADVDPRDAHRLGRPLLLVPGRGQRRPDLGSDSGLFALHDGAARRLQDAARGTSETFGTNDAASEVAAACSWSVDATGSRAGRASPSRRGCRS